MDMSDFSLVWKRIKALEGETFRQIRGAEFTYEIFGAALKPNRTNQYLHRGQFEKAFKPCRSSTSQKMTTFTCGYLPGPASKRGP